MENKTSIKTDSSSHNWSEEDDEEEESLLPAAAMEVKWCDVSRDSSSTAIKRERLTNWSPEERTLFHGLVEQHLDVVLDKANNSASIANKKRAWADIHLKMLAAGYNRPTDKLRQAWSRRKLFQKRIAPKKQLPSTAAAAPLRRMLLVNKCPRPKAEASAVQSVEMHFLRKQLLEKQIEAEERRLAHVNLLIEKDAIIKNLEIQKLKLSMNIVT